MANNPENGKKIIRRKSKKLFDKRVENKGAGRKPLEAADELSLEQKSLCQLMARGIPQKVIEDQLKISTYKINRYLKLPLVQTELGKLIELHNKEGLEKFCITYDLMVDEALNSAIRLLRADKLSESRLLEIIDSKRATLGLTQQYTELEQTQSITKTMKSTSKEKVNLFELAEQDDTL